MKIGASTQGYVRPGESINERIRQVVQQGVLADKVGLASFGMSEQHFNLPTNTTAAMSVMYGALAVSTKRISLHPGSVILPLHHPLLDAEDWATVDTLSNGRLNFSVGRGNNAKTCGIFGVNMDESADMTREAIELIVKSWTSESFTHQGKYYTVGEPITMVPRPVQQPHPGVYGAATSVGACALIGSWKIGLDTIARGLSWDDIQRRLEAYSEAWETAEPIAGVTPLYRPVIHVQGMVAGSMQEAKDAVAEGLVNAMKRVIQYHRHHNHTVTHGNTSGIEASVGFSTIDDYVERTPMVMGTADQCVEALLRFHAQGWDEAVVSHDYATHDQIMSSIERLGTEVMPRFLKEISRKSA